MRTELQSLSKIFSESIFRIPDYQRGFSWSERQLKEYWNDLVDLEDANNHYTGVLTLEIVAPEIWSRWEDDRWIIESKKYRPYHIVDGQQRLTTSIILIQAILERMEDGDQLNHYSKSEIYSKYISQKPNREAITFALLFGYEKDNPSYEFLKSKVLGLESGKHSLEEETIYTKNLSCAKDFFVGKLKELDLAGIELIFEKLTQRFLFNTFMISDEVDVFVAFETMNNRGKPLSNLEILKNRLIYLSTKVAVADGQDPPIERSGLRSVINESWKAAYHYLGKISGSQLRDDSFLLMHFFVYFGGEVIDFEGEHPEWDVMELEDGSGYKDFLLDEVFTVRRISSDSKMLSVGEIYNYSIDIKNSVKVYLQICEPAGSSLSGPEKLWLSRISRIVALRRYREHELGTLLLAVFRVCKSPKKRAEFLEALERHEVFSFIGKHEFSGTTDLILLAVKIVTGLLSIDDALLLLKREAEEFSVSPVLKKRLGTVGKDWGSYKWPFIRYFMFEYEQFLLARSKTNRSKLAWDRFTEEDYHSDYVTIEHIYPQKADDSWSDFRRYRVKQRNILRHSLGNLLALSRRKNSSLSNKSFAEKKASADGVVGYSNGCYSEIEVSRCNEWSAVAITTRSLTLLKFFEVRWGVKLGSDEEKLAMLGLGFMWNEIACRK